MSKRAVLENDTRLLEKTEAKSSIYGALPTLQWNARHHNPPSAHWVVPSDYALHLLGDSSSKTVLVVGYGTAGVRTLLRLNANVIYVDASGDTSLESVEAGCVDHVLCLELLRHVDAIVTARRIRRALKPGGTALFNESLDNRTVSKFKKLRTGHDWVTSPVFTLDDADSVCRAVGRPGRRKEFWLSTPLLNRMGFGPNSKFTRISQRADAALLRRFVFARKFALQLVFEAQKEC